MTMESLGTILRRIAARGTLMRSDVFTEDDYLGKPECRIPNPTAVHECLVCNGTGWLAARASVGDSDFGKAFPCRCQESEEDQPARTAALERYSNLGPLRQCSFESADPSSFHSSPASRKAFQEALSAAEVYAEKPIGWITLAGPSGSGKTFLAAAIANRQIELGQAALFVTCADLLDYLRSGFNDDEEWSFMDRLSQVREAPLLILDDLPTNPATPWWQERLFQLLAHRHSSRLSTVITLRGDPGRADEFLRTRLETSDGFARMLRLGRPGQLLTSMAGEIPPNMRQRMTFDAFRTNGNGQIANEKSTGIAGVHAFVQKWVENPAPYRWLALLGPLGVGKTHLAVAAAVERENRGDDVFFATVADLLDYLRATFSPDSPIAHIDLLQRIKMVDLLVLDDFGAERSTPFAEDKLFQIINYRYEERLPTIITTSHHIPEIASTRPHIASRLQDENVVLILGLEGPDYRQGGARR